LENLGNFRFLVLDLFTWEIRHASICASVGRRVLLWRDQPRQCEGGLGIQPSTARTTIPSFGHTGKVI